MKMKKLLSFLLVFVLLFSLLSFTVSASDDFIGPPSQDELHAPDNIWEWFQSVWKDITNIYDMAKDIRDKLINSVADAISNGFTGLWNYLDTFEGDINSVISLLTNGIPYEIRTGIDKVTAYLNDTYTKLTTVADLLKNHLTDSFVIGLKQARDYISNISSKVHDMYNVISLGLESKLKDIRYYIIHLPTTVVDEIKVVFIPDIKVLEAELKAAVVNITSQFGIHFDTYERLFDTEIAPEDVVEDYNIPGIGILKLKFLDTSYLIKGVAFFRPFIRGFLVLLLVFYNWKQALTLFDQNPAIAGSAIQGLSGKGGEPGE